MICGPKAKTLHKRRPNTRIGDSHFWVWMIRISIATGLRSVRRLEAVYALMRTGKTPGDGVPVAARCRTRMRTRPSRASMPCGNPAEAAVLEVTGVRAPAYYTALFPSPMMTYKDTTLCICTRLRKLVRDTQSPNTPSHTPHTPHTPHPEPSAPAHRPPSAPRLSPSCPGSGTQA